MEQTTPIPAVKMGDEDIRPVAHILTQAGIRILSLDEGYVACPGIELHTTKNAATDCKAYNNNGVPFLYCFHNSCATVVAAHNKALSIWVKGTCHEFARRESVPSNVESEIVKAKEDLPVAVLRDYAWDYAGIVADERGRVTTPLTEQWMYLVALFPPDATLWIGRDLYDSGKPGHRWRFRTSDEWLGYGECPGSFICPNSFHPGVSSRITKNVARRHFLVVESDELTRDQVGAVFRFLESSHVGMHLRAIVDTGGKSLHGWFDFPDKDTFRALRSLLPALKCDEKMFGATQPSRLPGALRVETGRHQNLIYFPLEDQTQH